MKKYSFLLLYLILVSCENDDYILLNDEIDNTSFSKAPSGPTGLDKQILDDLENISGGVGVSFFILPESNQYSNIPQDPLNPITPEKVALGKLLFHETATGGNPTTPSNLFTYSCASCHHAAAGFGAGIRQGIGEAGIGFGTNGEGRVFNPNIPTVDADIQPIRSPTVLNVAYQDIMLWNGQFGGSGTNLGTEANWTNIPENFIGFEGVEVQAIKGQGVHRLLVDDSFVTSFGYKQMFDDAFPNSAMSERYSTTNAALAIAAYERTILPNQSPWQQWLNGNYSLLSNNEKKGAKAFFGKGKCYQCHTGPALNDKNFYAFGMGDFDNTSEAFVLDQSGFENVKKGRGGFTKVTTDDYKFKTPTLYNLIDNGVYGHGGTFTSVREVIEYKIEGVPENTEVPTENLAEQFGDIKLNKTEIDNLVLFIENSLRDPNLSRYVPLTINSGNCFPNNDSASRIDLGCD
ncbi:cytochrome-c peroxidase [Aquimarina sp. BL5]|uniref:cytochrome-c peroxidase n=1 Tax=Aquimarina sp. BL5 TaxID=1714860 RepID=UPI000E4EC105|nr:cytochrome c peroxidase [Aquimarina sp. BL5]AXT52703.1 cytochrome-c peroxidase [Aquimarina sp. BL5]RKN08288.1 cytochrome-c peroxidase [Aquimarina sp. BL5]